MIKLKVPESAHMRIELNKIDSAGLDNAEALRFSLFFLSSSQTNITTMKNFLMLVMLKSDSSALRMVDIMAAQQLGLPERSLPSNSSNSTMINQNKNITAICRMGPWRMADMITSPL